MRLAPPTRHLLLFLAALLTVFGLRAFWDYTIDDAFITFRYSHHLASGAGLVWNPGEAPVEGYTNFALMLLLAGADWLGLPLVAVAKGVGVACLLLTALLIFRHVHQQTADEAATFVALFAFLAFLPVYVHAVAGLETMLYVALLLWATIRATQQVQRRAEAGLWQVPLLVLLTGLTRPEGILAGAVPLLYLLLGQPAALRRRTLLAAFLALVLPGAVYFGWRLAYFGWFFPNTFYVKVGHLWAGIFWAVSSLLLLAPLLLFVALTPGEGHLPGEHPASRRLGYYLTVAGVALLPYAASQLMMNYAHRFLFHVYPLLVVMLGLTAAALRRVSSVLPSRRWGLVSLLLLLVAARVGATDMGGEALYGYHLANAHVAMGRALAHARVEPAHRSLAIGDAGAVPFYSGWQTIDYIGLNDVAIAHGQDPAARIRSALPSLVILYSSDGVTPSAQMNGFDHGAVLAGYEPLAAVLWRPAYYLNVYVRSDLPAAERAELAARLGPVAATAAARNSTDGWLAWFAHKLLPAGGS